VSKTWRFDRMSTVCDPGSGRITASFAGVAKHYGVAVAVCPPRRGNRKGVVEKVNHTAAQRWWRTLADDVTVEQAQVDLDRFASVRGDTRMRATAAMSAASSAKSILASTPDPHSCSDSWAAANSMVACCSRQAPREWRIRKRVSRAWPTRIRLCGSA
jgi:hypothetical protein